MGIVNCSLYFGDFNSTDTSDYTTNNGNITWSNIEFDDQSITTEPGAATLPDTTVTESIAQNFDYGNTNNSTGTLIGTPFSDYSFYLIGITVASLYANRCLFTITNSDHSTNITFPITNTPTNYNLSVLLGGSSVDCTASCTNGPCCLADQNSEFMYTAYQDPCYPSQAYDANGNDVGPQCNYIITDFQYQIYDSDPITYYSGQSCPSYVPASTTGYNTNYTTYTGTAITPGACNTYECITGETELWTTDSTVITAADLSTGMSIAVSDGVYDTVQYISKYSGAINSYVYGINGETPFVTHQHPIQIRTEEC